MGFPVKLRADHEIVVLVWRAQHARSKPLAKFKGTSSSDNWTRGDNGEIAVPENAAGHTHVSWPLRNRSDGYFKQPRADPDRDIARDGTASCPPYLHSARDLEPRGDGE